MKIASNNKVLWQGEIDDRHGRIIAVRGASTAIVEFASSTDALGQPAFRTAEGSERDAVLDAFIASQASKLFRAPRTPKTAAVAS